MSTSAIGPAELLQELLTATKRTDRRENLRLVDEICRIQASSSRDFSLSTIGKLVQAGGGLNARAIYNASSADYRALIAAWANSSGTVEKDTSRPEGVPVPAWVRSLQEPGVRSLVTALIVDRNRLRAEMNLLKSVTTLQISFANQKGTFTQAPAQAVLPAAFTESERSAMAAAVSPEFFEQEDWRNGPAGSVVKANGRTLFEPGFVTAIGKALKWP